jgi:hypothetical protein
VHVRVAVDDALRPVKEQLLAGGFDVVRLAGGVPEDVQAIVVNGLDDNLMGRQDIVARVPIVNADGMTPTEVAEEVSRRVRRTCEAASRDPMAR